MKRNKRKYNKNFCLISIKGKDYVFRSQDEIDDGDTLGEINYSTKQITVAKDNYQIDHTILHELIHGFFHECGMRDWSNNEALVNWMAHNLLEIYDVYCDITHTEVYHDMIASQFDRIEE